MFKINIDVYDTDETYLYHSCDDAQEALSYFNDACRIKERAVIELVEVKEGFVTIIKTKAVGD